MGLCVVDDVFVCCLCSTLTRQLSYSPHHLILVGKMYQVRELAEKEGEGGVFQLLRQDVTRFLTTILIGTTYGLLVQFYALAIIVFWPKYDNSKCQFSLMITIISDVFP